MLVAQQEIARIIDQYMIRDDIFLVDIIVSGRQQTSKILVLIDGEGGVSIDTCAKMSRKISEELDQLGVFSNNYVLEVSSPGLEHPLKLKRQYYNHVGKKVRVTLNDSSIRNGKLLEILDTGIILNESTDAGTSNKKVKPKLDYRKVEILFKDIQKTNVLVSFN